MYNTIYINKKNLSNQENPLDKIYDYFNGFDIINIQQNNKYYTVSLKRSDFTYCENFIDELSAFKISLEDVNKFCCIKNATCLCISESWIPYALFYFLKKYKLSSRKISILHIDSHADLMSPFISYENGIFYNMLNNKTIDFKNEKSIYDTINTGAITIGSILTTIVFNISKINILHLKQDVNEEFYQIEKQCILDDFIGNHNRIAVRYTPVQEYIGKGSYLVTSQWDSIINALSIEDTCILHIDMDYFNNRYNASTDWENNKFSHDPPLAQQLLIMDEVCDNIKFINEYTKIACILVGISPSFYPIEFWKKGLSYLFFKLQRINIDATVISELF